MYSCINVVIENAAKLAEEDKVGFALARRLGFGASDSATLLGLSKWSKLSDLIATKNSDEITEDEIAVGNKPQVRMGADLEPLILEKFCKQYNVKVIKPDAQYRLADFPMLTINYDGLLGDGTPVEIKTVSVFADKYWDWDKAITHLDEPAILYATQQDATNSVIKHRADQLGIPEYYYTQVQQQLIGTPKCEAYLVAMRMKDWNLYVFKIGQDEATQQRIIEAATEAAGECPKIIKLVEE